MDGRSNLVYLFPLGFHHSRIEPQGRLQSIGTVLTEPNSFVTIRTPSVKKLTWTFGIGRPSFPGGHDRPYREPGLAVENQPELAWT